MDNTTRTELEAAAFRRLVGHLRERTDVQNIDLMNLAGFCRNCLSNWYKDAPTRRGWTSTTARSYGPFAEWKRSISRKPRRNREPPSNHGRPSTPPGATRELEASRRRSG